MASTTTQLDESITLEQLANHDTLKSLWIAVHGRVYDLTDFSSDHPGGVEALQSSAGTDGTEAYEYAGHSEENMVKMEHFRIGKLAGSLEQESSISHNPLAVETLPVEVKRLRSAAYGVKQSIAARSKLAITITATPLIVALSYPYLSSALHSSQLQLPDALSSTTSRAFWAGIAIASAVSCVVFRYFYVLFLSSLEYHKDVFSYPPTIPRKTKR